MFKLLLVGLLVVMVLAFGTTVAFAQGSGHAGGHKLMSATALMSSHGATGGGAGMMGGSNSGTHMTGPGATGTMTGAMPGTGSMTGTHTTPGTGTTSGSTTGTFL